MTGRLNYRHTVLACYAGYITQAIIVNLAPLLFVTFNTKLGVSLEQLGLLVSFNFGVQIVVDFLCAKYILRIGYRRGAMAAHICSVVGLVLLGLLPGIMESAYAGLLIATAFCALGGGLIEVLVSPIVESLPGDEKASAMSLLHSFYCWGHVAVVLLSTLYFGLAGIDNWRWLPMLWAVVPLANTFFFAAVPLRPIAGDDEKAPFKRLFTSKLFWIFAVLMICAGASEQAMSQWSSMFAEAGLGVSKTLGDLLGPCAFAVCMGLGRLLYGIFGSKIDVSRALWASALLCVAGYMIAVFAPHPVLSLAGCAVTGLAVALMWPGTLSMAATANPTGGTAMFSMFALAGDIGCSAGPGVVGLVSGAAQRAGGGILAFLAGDGGADALIKAGILVAVVFPIVMAMGARIARKWSGK